MGSSKPESNWNEDDHALVEIAEKLQKEAERLTEIYWVKDVKIGEYFFNGDDDTTESLNFSIMLFPDWRVVSKRHPSLTTDLNQFAGIIYGTIDDISFGVYGAYIHLRPDSHWSSNNKFYVAEIVVENANTKSYRSLSAKGEFNPKAVNQIVRSILKENFPGTKFSVRSHSGSTRIEWVDGPTINQVQKLIGKYEGKRFDAWQDLEEYTDTDAEFVVDYILPSRSFSNETMEEALDYVIDNYSIDMTHPEKVGGVDPEIVRENVWVDNNGYIATEDGYQFKFGNEWLNDFINRMLHRQDLSSGFKFKSLKARNVNETILKAQFKKFEVALYDMVDEYSDFFAGCKVTSPQFDNDAVITFEVEIIVDADPDDVDYLAAGNGGDFSGFVEKQVESSLNYSFPARSNVEWGYTEKGKWASDNVYVMFIFFQVD